MLLPAPCGIMMAEPGGNWTTLPEKSISSSPEPVMIRKFFPDGNYLLQFRQDRRWCRWCLPLLSGNHSNRNA